MENDLNGILHKLDKITDIYSSISDVIISNDYKIKFNDTVIKYKYNFDKILKKDLPLKVCVVGTMKTGKSEFINSLIKDNLLAVSDIPMTKKVTVFKYNEEFKIFKVFYDKTREEISKEDHKELCNHKYINGHKRIVIEPDNINYFEVHYPADILKNINIADTPGFSSRYKDDDELTKSWIKKADCLIWLFNADITITSDEEKLLKEVSLESAKIIAVVNRMDGKEESQKDKILNYIKNRYKFYDIIPYSALEICKFETLVKKSGDNINKIFLDAKNSLLYGKNINEHLNPGCLLIKDVRITEDLIDSIKKYDLNNEYVDYKDKVKSMLKEIKKDPVNIKSDVLYKRAFEVLKKESKNLIHYRQPVESSIDTEKSEILRYNKLRNDIIVYSESHLKHLLNEKVIEFSFEDIIRNSFNRYINEKTIEIDDLISNRMFSEFINTIYDIFNKVFENHVNKVKINIILIEYIRNNLESLFKEIITRISSILEKGNIDNSKLSEKDFYVKYRSEFFKITSDLYSPYEKLFHGFTNYYIDKYIIHEIYKKIEGNEKIKHEINELLKESQI